MVDAPPGNAPLSLDAPLRCGCQPCGLRVEVSAPDFLLLHCPGCGHILAGTPVHRGTHVIAVQPVNLSEQESAQVRRATTIGPELPLPQALDHLLACTQPAAVRVAQTRLQTRPNLLSDLHAALSGADAAARLTTLQLIARMPLVPGPLRGPARHAIRTLLRLPPTSDDVLVALMALHPLAAGAAALRGDVQSVVNRLPKDAADRTQAVRQIAGAVTTAIDRALAARAAQLAETQQTLAQLATQGAHADARAVLDKACPPDDPDDPDGGMPTRMALCEAAADQVVARDRAAARVLLEWALEAAQIYASWSTAGGEGMARMLDVNRLRQRLQHGR